MNQISGSKPVAWLMTRKAVEAFVGVAAILAGLSACGSGFAGPMETLAIAMVPSEVNALIYVAEAQDFFRSNRLSVILKEDYDSGATATAGMLHGEADIASASEFLIVRKVFDKEVIISFGTIARYENTFIIWPAESGIGTIADLKGKKIGLPLGTIAEFYLGRALDLNSMNIQEVTLVDVRAAESEKAVSDGDVDAVVTWEPWANQINQSMGKDVITSALQSSQYAYWNLVATPDWINGHTDAIEKLIKSLAQAEGYIASHQDEVKAMIGKRMNLDDTYVGIVWERYQFALSLDQSLIAAMEDEARWMIANNLTEEEQVPNFLNHIYADGLEVVYPYAVNYIH
jgi:NitT/TauT family transport system substrate-binding protein